MREGVRIFSLLAMETGTPRGVTRCQVPVDHDLVIGDDVEVYSDSTRVASGVVDAIVANDGKNMVISIKDGAA